MARAIPEPFSSNLGGEGTRQGERVGGPDNLSAAAHPCVNARPRHSPSSLSMPLPRP